MKKILFFVALAISFGACKEAEIPLYDKPEQAINFWVPPTPGAITKYPDALNVRYTFDFGSAEYFLSQGLLAFSTRPQTVIPAEAGVEIMGFVPVADHDVKLTVVAEESADELDATFVDGYKIAAGEATASFPFSVKMTGVPMGQSRKMVVTFDYSAMDMMPGVVQRQKFTVECASVTESTPRVPTSVNDFNFASFILTQMWDWDYGMVYGAISLNKFKFMSVILGTTDLANNLPGTFAPINGLTSTAAADMFNEKLAEYKALNAEDPVNYPPLYQSGETWISFP